MTDDVLSLVARIKDESSGPLRKIREAMRNMKLGNEGPIAARKAFKEWNGTLKETHERIGKVHEASRRGLEPALDMLNLKTAVAAGGVATLVEGLKRFADQGNELVGFSHKARLSIETIRDFDGIADKFHVDPAELRQSEMTIVDSMDRIRRHKGEFYAYLKVQRPKDAAALAATPDTMAGNEQALRITLRMLAQIKQEYGEGRARIFAKENLGSDALVDLVRDGLPALDEAIAKYRQLAGAMDAQKGEDFAKSFSDFKASLEGLRNQAGADFLPEITKGVKELTTYVSEHKGEIEDGLVTVVRDIGATAKEAWPAVKEMATAANDAATAMGGWGRVIEGFALAKMAGYAFGFTRMAVSVFGLAGAFRALGKARSDVPDLKTGKTPEAKPAETPTAANDNPAGRSLMEEIGESAKRLAAGAGGGFAGAASSLGTLLMLVPWARQSDIGMGRSPTAESLAKNPLGIRLPGEAQADHTPASYHTPAAYDREVRARAGSDDQDHSLDGVVVGSLGQEVIHLNGTLKTLAAKQDGGIIPASFRTGAGVGSSSAAEEIMANGTYRGVLKALIDFANQSAMGAGEGLGGGEGGFSLASFHPGGGMGGGSGGRGAGSGGGGNFSFSGTGTSGWEKSGASKAQVAAYIRHTAAALGIDPSIALRVAASEGLNKYTGDYGTSFGAYQLHYGGSGIRGMNSGGLGDRFTKETGLDARDPSTWRQQIQYALKTARREGWGAWHGWRGARNAGIGTYNGPVPSADDYDRSSGPVGGALGRLKLASRVASVQCVALANAAVGFSGSVKDWRKGIGAAEGSLVDGTPIATFLNRDGSQSDRYAGGGIGTEGAHLDHAAIFRRYLKDAAGKIIGMTVAEQSRGRPLHLRDYKFGEGWGEGNGSNYNAILGPDGKPLGGARNPMTRRPGDLTKKASEAQAQIHRVHGTGELAVKVDAPRGTRVAATGGGLFTKVSLNRGYSMAPASETG